MDRLKTENVIYTSMVFLCILFAMFCAIALTGCCGTTPQYLIKDRVITVKTPEIHDTLFATIKDTLKADSAYWDAYKITDTGDTTLKARIYPKQYKAVLDVKPKFQNVAVKDSIPIPKPEIKEIEKTYPLISKIGWIALGACIGVLIMIGKKFINL